MRINAVFNYIAGIIYIFMVKHGYMTSPSLQQIKGDYIGKACLSDICVVEWREKD